MSVSGSHRGLQVLLVAFVTLAAAQVAMIILLSEKLGTLNSFKDFIDATFQKNDRKEMALKALGILAHRAEVASQRVISLQQDGLKGLGINSDPEHAGKDFEAMYANALADFRSAQDAFYKYLDLVFPFGIELGLELNTRNFKNYLPTHSWQGGIPAKKA